MKCNSPKQNYWNAFLNLNNTLYFHLLHKLYNLIFKYPLTLIFIVANLYLQIEESSVLMLVDFFFC